MASTIISSFFTKNGIPQTGLVPTIRIWEINGTSQTLIVGSPNGTGVTSDGIMEEVIDIIGSPGGSPLIGSKDGFYKFEFTDAIGFNITKKYLVRTDGGITLPGGERYQSGELDPSLNLIDINVTNVLDIVDEILKYDQNRTFIDVNNFTLTVFDDDGTTPLKVFDLKDETGVASITRIFERIPQ